MVSTPLVVSTLLLSISVTLAVLMTAASLVPKILTVTVLVVPSVLATVKTSLYTAPPANSLCAELAVYTHWPLACSARLPYVPVKVPVTKVAWLSTSVMLKAPDDVRMALVSSRPTVAAPITAASLVPRMLTVIVLAVPSLLATAKVSV